MKNHCWLADWLAGSLSVLFTSLPTSINSQTCPQATQTWAILQLQLLLQVTLVCVTLTQLKLVKVKVGHHLNTQFNNIWKYTTLSALATYVLPFSFHYTHGQVPREVLPMTVFLFVLARLPHSWNKTDHTISYSISKNIFLLPASFAKSG